MILDDSRPAELAGFALEMGLTRAKTIGAAEVIVRDEVVSAGCAGCPQYGRNLMCPPTIPSPAGFRKTLSGYRQGLLVQLSAPLSPERAGGDYREAFIHARRLHQLVCALEERARGLGFSRARGFIGGCCRLCETCPGPGGQCRNPEKARSSMEANGVDVVNTCAAAGWPLEFPVRDSVTWTGLVLLD